jgi:hypothetical protein
MTAVNCPMCELRFPTRSERDWHLRNEHEHLHVHRPTDRPLEWRHHGTPSHVDDRGRDAEADAAHDEVSRD